MGEVTHISWCDHTFNGWVGCMKVSPACDGCYAEHLMDTRMGRVTFGGPGKGVGTRQRTSATNWKKPLTWDRKATKDGTRPFVFCSSLADVFDNAVPADWRRDLFKLIQATPHLTWLLLTKRPQNIVRMWMETFADESGPPVALTPAFWPRNAAIGCTVVTQEEADRDVPHLLRAKAALDPAFAFLSMEPLLGAVDISKWLPGGYECSTECGWRSATPPPWEACTTCGAQSLSFGEFCACGAAEFEHICPSCDGRTVHEHPDTPCVDWVITGGETDQGGHKARPTHPKWLRDIRDQCAAAGVAYHHKQNGEWSPDGRTDQMREHYIPETAWPDGTLGTGDHQRNGGYGRPLWRVGKARAGRLLDGAVHDARPAVRA